MLTQTQDVQYYDMLKAVSYDCYYITKGPAIWYPWGGGGMVFSWKNNLLTKLAKKK